MATATILDSLTEIMTPDMINRMGKTLGVNTSTLNKGLLGTVAPVILGSLAKKASTPGGADSLLKSLPQDMPDTKGGDLLGSVIGMLTGGKDTGGNLVNILLGPGIHAIGGTLSKALGFNVVPLLTMLAPMIAGLVNKSVKEQNLDAAGLGQMLQTQANTFMANPANKDTASIVSAALEAGDKAEALRNTFTDADWAKVRMAPLAALYLVTGASPSQLLGAVQEVSAATKAVAEAIPTLSPTSLLSTAFGGGLDPSELEQLKKDAPSRESSLSTLRDGLALVKQKSPADASAFRDLVMSVAQKTAEAAKEGGLLGIGGKRISKEEQAALDAIKAALA